MRLFLGPKFLWYSTAAVATLFYKQRTCMLPKWLRETHKESELARLVYSLLDTEFLLVSALLKRQTVSSHCHLHSSTAGLSDSKFMIRGAHNMFCNLEELMTSLLCCCCCFLLYIIDQFYNTCDTKFYLIPYNHFHSMRQNVR